MHITGGEDMSKSKSTQTSHGDGFMCICSLHDMRAALID